MKKKIGLLILYISLLVIVIAIPVVVGIKGSQGGEISRVGKVNVTEGVTDVYGFSEEITIESGGMYQFFADWESEKGLITGVTITDEKGETISAFTAESMQMSTAPLELKSGKYQIEFRYLTDEQSANDFCESAGIEVTSSFADYDFKGEGTWETTYHISWEEAEWGETFNRLCIGTGVGVGLLAAAILILLTKKRDEVKSRFDERQEISRGKAFKYSFFSLMGCNILLAILSLMGVELFANVEVALFFSLFVAIGVFVCNCIWNDAYFALNERRQSLMIIFAAIGVVNLLIGIGNILNANLLLDGRLSTGFLNLSGGCLSVIVFVTMWLKHLKDRKDEQE